MGKRIIHYFRELLPDQLVLMLTGSRSEDLPILLVQTRENFKQMFIRLPRTENNLRKSAPDFPVRIEFRISHLLEWLFFEIFFCLFDRNFVAFYFF